MFEPKFEPKPKPAESEFAQPERARMESGASPEPKQRRMMEIALSLLLVALGLVLYHDRDFWFPESPDSQEADAGQMATAPGQMSTEKIDGKMLAAGSSSPRSQPPKYARNGIPLGSHANNLTAAAPPASATGQTAAANPGSPDSGSSESGFAVSTQRTVLPPLEVEVVAGDVHRTVRPGSNSVHVELQAEPPTVAGSGTNDPENTAAEVTRGASEQVAMSTDTSAAVTSSVKPAYPLLARQMRVQGSVILQALIGKDGAIQDLHVVSGPPILAAAAQEAVRQWHFKPHYQGAESVETLAKITVNFTISTN